MGESLVITLREGIEAALVVGIILAYLTRVGRDHLRQRVFVGLGLALAASIAFAIVIQAIGMDPENEYMEGALLGVAGILVATLVVWMWRVSRNVKSETERKLAQVVGKDDKGAGWGLVLFTFVMVFREGAETVLFLLSATTGQFSIADLAGGLLGISLAVLFAVFFVRGSLRVNLSRFFLVTSVVLLVLALKLVLGSVHEFAEVGVLPMDKDLMAVIGYFVRDQASTVILMALLIVPLLAVLWGSKPAAAQPDAEETSMERRKRLAVEKRAKVWRAGLVLAGVLVTFAMASTAFGSSGVVDPVPVRLTADGGRVFVPASSLPEDALSKFVHTSNGIDVTFLAVRTADGAVAVSLDACQICGAKGYGQDGREVVCKNCNAPIAIDTIGQGGGCNPLPLEADVDQSGVTVYTAGLAEAEVLFAR